MELLYRFTASLTETEVVGVVPEGLRLDVHFEGQVIAGALVGARVRGLDYLLLRADGVGVIDEYETIDAGDGRVVSAHAQGYIVPPEGAEFPRPEVLLSPDFTWPDGVPLPLRGFVLYRTGAPDLAHLNRVVASFHGHIDVGRTQLVVEARRWPGPL
jgi:hypothetical protein